MMTTIKVVHASNKLEFECGCIVEWPLIGQPECHITSCKKHENDEEEVKKLADTAWEYITSEVRS